MKLSETESALIISPENRKYYTGFDSSNGYYLITGYGNFFITDSRYIEEAKNTVKNAQIVLQTHPYKQIESILTQLHIKSMYIEASRTTLCEYNSMKEIISDIEIISDGTLDSEIYKKRNIKSEDEKQKIIRAQRIAEAAFDDIVLFIKPGISEKEVAIHLNFFMLTHGADDISFETIAISGSNTSKPHGVPTDKKLQPGEFITMDFGSVVDGYHSDMTRTVALGSATEKMKKIYDIVLRSQNAAIKEIKAGKSASEIDAVARNIISDAGYGPSFGHSLGHGVGIEIHEHPVLSPNSKEILSSGNVVTVEPGIYLENEFGVRIEDMIYVCDGGYINLTECPKVLRILPV